MADLRFSGSDMAPDSELTELPPDELPPALLLGTSAKAGALGRLSLLCVEPPPLLLLPLVSELLSKVLMLCTCCSMAVRLPVNVRTSLLVWSSTYLKKVRKRVKRRQPQPVHLFAFQTTRCSQEILDDGQMLRTPVSTWRCLLAVPQHMAVS